MKTLKWISLFVVALFIFTINVNLNTDGNKIISIGLATSQQTAKADAYCYYHTMFEDCMCMYGGVPCGGVCPQGTTLDICNGA